MPNVLIIITSHDMCENMVVDTKNFTPEMNKLYNAARKDDYRAAYIEGYPSFHCGPGGIPDIKYPCMVDDYFKINCSL